MVARNLKGHAEALVILETFGWFELILYILKFVAEFFITFN